MVLKVLNLYAGIGGNRKLWDEIASIEVTAVEWDKQIANIYQDNFPNDKVIITDAHEFLEKNFDKFDFIWSSPPCLTHSRARFWGSFRDNVNKVYPDMSLYQQIIFLTHYAKNIKWVVENVKPYYEPLIKAQKCGRHLFWSNFSISKKNIETLFFPKDDLTKLQRIYRVDLSNLNINFDKRTVLRNCVHPKLGKHILECAFKNRQLTLLENREDD